MSKSLMAALALLACGGVCAESPRSAIFLHPDGMGANTWAALRLKEVGPDGRLNWDRLPRLAIYVGPMLDSVAASSNGGATTHAYGVRAALADFGMVGGKRPVAASGKAESVMHAARSAGKAIAIVNSSSITEPGTAAFLASVADRDNETEIAAQILAARPDVILGGGEMFMLPKGQKGRHGKGVREDGRNLIAEAAKAGYRVVYTREELRATPLDGKPLLGVFAAEATFNEYDEAGLARRKLAAFQPQAPRFDEMLAVALSRVRDAKNGFLIVANEEGTDNLSGENNAPATLEAAAGADRAIGLALAEANANPALTVIVASDSDNGGMNATGDDLDELPRPLPKRMENGSPLDSDDGKPFQAAPDARGVRQPFYVTWASGDDMGGGTVARGIGPGARFIEGTIDSTVIYRALYDGLFAEEPKAEPLPQSQ